MLSYNASYSFAFISECAVELLNLPHVEVNVQVCSHKTELVEEQWQIQRGGRGAMAPKR